MQLQRDSTHTYQILYQQIIAKIHRQMRMQSVKGDAAVKTSLNSVIAGLDSLDDANGEDVQPSKKRKLECICVSTSGPLTVSLD
jgi:hypothetical protein